MNNMRTRRQFFFRIFIHPLFPIGQWIVLVLGVVGGAKDVEGPHNRQQFLLGFLKSEVTLEDAKQHLLTQGFSINRIAYSDPGQKLSVRQLCEEFSDRQYHIRIFQDGEIRGHYEYTPEDRPFKHLKKTIFEKRPERFNLWLNDILQNNLSIPPNTFLSD